MEKNALEVKSPGGKIVAMKYEEGGMYPGICLYFESESGEQYDLCFAEHLMSQMDPSEVRVGVFYSDGSEVSDVFEYDFSEGEEDA